MYSGNDIEMAGQTDGQVGVRQDIIISRVEKQAYIVLLRCCMIHFDVSAALV